MEESRVERGQQMKTRTNAYLPILLVLPALLAGCGQTSSQPAEAETGPVQESQQETVRLQEEAEEEDTVILQEEETDTAVTALPLPEEEEGKAEVSVSEIFNKEGDALTQEGSEYHYAYHIPKIEDDTAAAAEINAKINSIYASSAEECYDSIQSGEEPYLASITYETFQSGDVLSLLLSCTGYYDGSDSYDVFHYDTKKGECLENRDILSLSGMSDAEYGAALCRAAAAFFDDFCFPGWDLLNPDPGFYELRAQTLTYGNEDLSYPIWLDGDELHTIAKIASPAGEGFFFRDLLIRKEQETERKTAQLGDYLMAALQQDQVLLFVNAHDLEVADGDGLAAHVAGKAQALEHAGRGGALADRTRSAMEVRTVAAGAAAEAVALHDARETLALGRALDVDLLDVGEVGNRHGVAGVVLGGAVQTDLAQVLDRLDAPLLEVTGHRLVDLLGLDGAEAQLHGLVTVGLGGLHLDDGVRLGLDDGDRDELVVLGEQLGHAQLGSVDSRNHAYHSPTA